MIRNFGDMSGLAQQTSGLDLGFATDSGMSKIFTGLIQPLNPQNGDIWVKSDIIIKKTVFDKDFNLSNTYSDGSLVFYITSNPSDSGYKAIVDLFNRTSKIDMFVPLFLAAFYSSSTWQYPIVYVYVSGSWTYLSGIFIDSTLNLMTFTPAGASTGKVNLNRYLLDGTQNLTNAQPLSTSFTSTFALAALSHPLQNKKYMAGIMGSSTNRHMYITDKDGTTASIALTLPYTGSSGNLYHLIADNQYLFVCNFINASLDKWITKIDLSNDNIVSSVSMTSGEFTTSTKYRYYGTIAQDSSYLFMHGLRVAKSDLSYTVFSPFVTGTYKAIDKSGRLLEVSCTGTTVTINGYTPLGGASATLVKTVTVTLDYTTASGEEINAMAIDKDDNIIIYSKGSGGPYSAPSSSGIVAKLQRNAVSDSWTFLASVMTLSGDCNTNLPQAECDIYGNVYGKFNNSSGYSMMKLNPSLATVWSKTSFGSSSNVNMTFALEPCNIASDLTRAYHK